MLTEGGAHFVTPLSLSALAEAPVRSSLWDLEGEARMGHIALSRAADLIVVCPATADLIARAATGQANDLASTLLLATDTPVLMVPAMNVRMWQHAATRRNVAQLRGDGVTVMEPDEGEMACGEFGPGRLPTIPRHHGRHRRAAGAAGACPAVTSSSPPGRRTSRSIPVRFIGNRSSGKQGFAIAAALAAEGARVTLVAGPGGAGDPGGRRPRRCQQRPRDGGGSRRRRCPPMPR